MKEAAVTILAEESFHPSELQGAVQIGTHEATKRFKRYEAHVFSSSFPEKENDEIFEGVYQHRVRSNYFDKIIFMGTHFRNPYFCYLYKVAQKIKKMDTRIIHVRNRPLYMPYLRSILGKEYKLILHEHNQNIADTLSPKTALKVLNSIDAYVGVSKFTMDYEITNKYSQFAYKSCYILNGVNLELFRPISERKDEAEKLRKKYNLQNSKVILFVGAIRERKGIHHLVRAMPKIVSKHPNAKLIIAGGSKDNLEPKDSFALMVKSEAKPLEENIIFLGFIPPTEINNIYLLPDIFVGPSIWDEPFGLVFAEASASGLPVVASRRGGIPEIIKDHESGLLIEDPSNTEDLADKIIYLLDNPEIAKKFGKRGRQLMIENFSWDQVAAEIEDLYDRLLQN